MLTMSRPTHMVLNNGVRMPVLGLGTYLMEPERTKRAVLDALSLGYRHIDTATFYGNEREVGEAIRESGIDRDEVFITTKLWNDDHGYDRAREAFRRSLRRLGTDHVDLYLIHWPMPGRLETWRALESIYEEGSARAIGVSNFMPRHLDELLDHGSVVPAVDQVEMHPFLQRNDVLDRCRRSGIAVEAFSPLARGRRLDDRTVVDVARKNGRTPAQVLIGWCLQRGVAAIPKTTSRERMRENLESLELVLSPEDMAALNGLEMNARTTTWDPHEMP
jgi:diketogulonate reductase-like aldo/keto reductase